VRRLLGSWLILTLAIAIAVSLVPGVDVDGGWTSYFWIAVLFGLANAVLGPVLRLLTAPLILVTLGLFALVVNGLLFSLTSWLSDSLSVDGFLSALLAAAVVSLVDAVLQALWRPGRRPRRPAARPRR
jgi:putative membrane protein